MTEEEFYIKKIFKKNSIPNLRNEFPHLRVNINSWYRSVRYNEIQTRKSFLENKIKLMNKIRLNNGEDIIAFSSEEFIKMFYWYENESKKCHYCSLLESDLEVLNFQDGHINKRYPKRGKSLELDRKKSHLPYTNINNLVLACYWCNNAKTDTFSEIEFVSIGNEIRKIWEQRLGKEL